MAARALLNSPLVDTQIFPFCQEQLIGKSSVQASTRSLDTARLPSVEAACAPPASPRFSERPVERLYCPLVGKKLRISPERQLLHTGFSPRFQQQGFSAWMFLCVIQQKKQEEMSNWKSWDRSNSARKR